MTEMDLPSDSAHQLRTGLLHTGIWIDGAFLRIRKQDFEWDFAASDIASLVLLRADDLNDSDPTLDYGRAPVFLDVPPTQTGDSNNYPNLALVLKRPLTPPVLLSHSYNPDPHPGYVDVINFRSRPREAIAQFATLNIPVAESLDAALGAVLGVIPLSTDDIAEIAETRRGWKKRNRRFMIKVMLIALAVSATSAPAVRVDRPPWLAGLARGGVALGLCAAALVVIFPGIYALIFNSERLYYRHLRRRAFRKQSNSIQ